MKMRCGFIAKCYDQFISTVILDIMPSRSLNSLNSSEAVSHCASLYSEKNHWL